MPELVRRSLMPVSAERLFAWHASPGAFERLIPPFESVKVLEKHGTIHDGDRLTMQMQVGPLPVRWVAEHQNYEEGRAFTDVQVSGPFARWRHTHLMEPVDEGHSVLDDHLRYRVPGRWLGEAAAGWSIHGRLERTFAFRHARTALDLRRHQATPGRLRVAITGASGLLGGALADFLTSGGHEVIRLVRHRPEPGSPDAYWDPSRLDGEVERDKLEGLDAVVHLAGAGIADQRWSPARKAEILDSRRVGTRVLSEALTRLARPPRVLVSASAVGYYGDGADHIFDEHHRVAGKGFLAEVCQAWELASEPAKKAGIRVVNLRLGVVLSPKSGALAKMLPAFQAGAGGPIGSGRQWLSWIGLDDALGTVLHLINDAEISGPVNAVAPQPVTQAEFAHTLGRVLHRPSFMPLPSAAVIALFGEMGQAALLEGQRVVPAVLQERKFAFATPWLEEALRWELGEVPAALVPPAAPPVAIG